MVKKMENEKAVKLALDNVIKEGLDDIFDKPFEVGLLNNKLFYNTVYQDVQKSINGNSFESLYLNNIEHVLLPKNSAFDFRRCALIQPIDILKYNSLIISIADDIEKQRIPVGKKRIFSYRFKSEKGYLFNKNFNITSFKRTTQEKAARKRTNIIVSCDISNFYDRLNLHRLENSLISIGCNKNKIKTINELLLFWSNRDSYGLPVGSNRSRILAEASLVGIDNFLLKNNIDFIRFVDDYRLFAPNTTVAHYWLTLLIERLWTEGLTINKSKTKIEASSKYFKENSNIEHLKRNEVKKDTNPFVIIAGYGGTVPTRYRESSEREKEKFMKKNISELLERITKKDFINSEEIIEIFKVIIIQNDFNSIDKILLSLDKYPQMTPYIVDGIKKNIESIPDAIVNKIKNIFIKKILQNQYIPEYLLISYIKLLGTKEFYSKDILMLKFEELTRTSGSYIGRILLEALEIELLRDDIIGIRNSYDRSNMWEKRQIIKLVHKHMNEEEKRAWLKNIKYIERNDLFLKEAIEKTKKNVKKRKKK